MGSLLTFGGRFCRYMHKSRVASPNPFVNNFPNLNLTSRVIENRLVKWKDANVHDVDFSRIMGNTASQCGLTNLNYRELAQLYEKYKHLGLEFLALQHDQFEEQDVSNNEILQFERAGDPMLDKGGSPDQGGCPDQGGNPGKGGGSGSLTLVKEITWEVCALANSNGGPSHGFNCFLSISAAAMNMVMQEVGGYGSFTSPVWRPDATHAMAVTDSNLGSAGTLYMLAFRGNRYQVILSIHVFTIFVVDHTTNIIFLGV